MGNLMLDNGSKFMRMEWEKPYIKKIIAKLAPSGKVLQVGFSQGFAATYIQQYTINHHTIIESDSKTVKKAKEWAKDYSNVTIIEDSWENALENLKEFDGIFFNECPIEIVSDTLQSQNEATLMVEQGKTVLSNAAQEIPELQTLKYTDNDLDRFCTQMADAEPRYVSIFLHELKVNKQITESQYETMLKKHKLIKDTSETKNLYEKHADNSFAFLQECLKSHMHKNSRFSCFCISPSSKYDNPEYFDQIITNSSLEYEEEKMPIEVPESCEYYKHKEALILCVTKLS